MARKPDPPLPGDCPGAIDRIRVGIGGWTFAPWRGGMFYPQGLPQRRELEYAARQLSAIEVNGTWYGAQKPATYANWAEQVPPGFAFSLKAPMRITQARALAGTAAQVQDFIGGVLSLGDALGPLLWQFDAGTRPPLDALSEFAHALPREMDGRALRHVLDVRDPALADARLVRMAREAGVALVFTDSAEHPTFADASGGLVYARLMCSRPDIETGYPAAELTRWAKRLRQWSGGEAPADLAHLTDASLSRSNTPREVFCFFIASAKQRNPAAAMALIRELSR